MRIKGLKRENNHRRGQGMLEFALAIPVFLLLLLGIIEFGRMFLMYTSVFAAAREGARYGAAVETLCDPTGLEDAARRVGFFAGDMNIGIQYDDGYGNPKTCEQTVLGDRVHVTASIHFRSITGVIPQLTLQSTARRTIIRQVFLEWTLEPTSANAGAIPPTVTFAPPPATPTPPGPTDTPDPNVTPLPPICEGTWHMEGSAEDKTFYYLDITNTSGVIRELTKIDISWDEQNNPVLQAVHYSPPEWGLIWSGSDDTSPFTYFIPEGDRVIIENNETITLRFTFSNNKNDEVIGVILYFGIGSQECMLQYTP